MTGRGPETWQHFVLDKYIKAYDFANGRGSKTRESTLLGTIKRVAFPRGCGAQKRLRGRLFSKGFLSKTVQIEEVARTLQ